MSADNTPSSTTRRNVLTTLATTSGLGSTSTAAADTSHSDRSVDALPVAGVDGPDFYVTHTGGQWTKGDLHAAMEGPQKRVSQMAAVSTPHFIGTNDDAQSIFDTVAAGDTVIFLSGTHTIDAPISRVVDDIHVTGDPGAILQISDGVDLDGPMLDLEGDNVEISGLEIDGNHAGQNTPQASAVSIKGMAPTVHHCYIHDFWVGVNREGRGIRLDSHGNANIHNNRLERVLRAIHPDLGSTSAANDRFHHNVIRNPENNPYNSTVDAQIYGFSAVNEGSLIDHNVVDFRGMSTANGTNAFPFVYTNENISILNNRAHNAIGESVYGQADRAIVAGNWFDGASNTSTGLIGYLGVQGQSIVSNNWIYNHEQIGVLVSNGDSVVSNNWIEYDSSVVSPRIGIQATGGNNTVTGNHVHAHHDPVKIHGEGNMFENNRILGERDNRSALSVSKLDSGDPAPECLCVGNVIDTPLSLIKAYDGGTLFAGMNWFRGSGGEIAADSGSTAQDGGNFGSYTGP